MDKTSRLWIVDAIEAIVNNIQLASHLQELIDAEEREHDAELVYIRDCVVEQRRDLMLKIRDAYDADQQYRCAVKHAIAAWGYTQEVYYANIRNEDFLADYEAATRIMYAVLSKFLKQEITDCGRCLLDSLQTKYGMLKLGEKEASITEKDPVQNNTVAAGTTTSGEEDSSAGSV